jgi:hypothetical protein
MLGSNKIGPLRNASDAYIVSGMTDRRPKKMMVRDEGGSLRRCAKPAYTRRLLCRRGAGRHRLESNLTPRAASAPATPLPDWSAAIIWSFGTQPGDYLGELNKELAAVPAELGVPPQSHGLTPAGAHMPPKAATKIVPQAPSEKTAASEGLSASPLKPRTKAFERLREIVELRAAEMILERFPSGRAAKSYRQPHQVFIKLNYTTIGDMAAQLVLQRGETEDCERVWRFSAEDVRTAYHEKGEAVRCLSSCQEACWMAAEEGRGRVFLIKLATDFPVADTHPLLGAVAA